jgi:hypothetical protein
MFWARDLDDIARVLVVKATRWRITATSTGLPMTSRERMSSSVASRSATAMQKVMQPRRAQAGDDGRPVVHAPAPGGLGIHDWLL